jgi:hypothetical protein
MKKYNRSFLGSCPFELLELPTNRRSSLVGVVIFLCEVEEQNSLIKN